LGTASNGDGRQPTESDDPRAKGWAGGASYQATPATTVQTARTWTGARALLSLFDALVMIEPAAVIEDWLRRRPASW